NPNALVLFPDLLAEPSPVRTTGLLPSHRLEDLIAAGHVRASTPILPDQIQPSSIDLRLGPLAYKVRASFLPNRHATVQKKLTDLQIGQLDLSKSALLERGSVYIVPLQEELYLPDEFYRPPRRVHQADYGLREFLRRHSSGLPRQTLRGDRSSHLSGDCSGRHTTESASNSTEESAFVRPDAIRSSRAGADRLLARRVASGAGCIPPWSLATG